MVRERIRVVTVMVMAVHRVEQTPHLCAEGVIESQHRVGRGTADRLRLLEQRRESPVVDALLAPGRLGEEAGQVGFVSTLQHTAGDRRQACVVQDDQAWQVMLEMVKLAPILEEVPEDIGMSGHEGSGGHDRKLHQALPSSCRGQDRA
jgi:DTW domain-containing protein YfiP